MIILALTDFGILFHGKLLYFCCSLLHIKRETFWIFSVSCPGDSKHWCAVYTLCPCNILSVLMERSCTVVNLMFLKWVAACIQEYWGGYNALHRRGTWPLCLNAVFVHNVEFHFIQYMQVTGRKSCLLY